MYLKKVRECRGRPGDAVEVGMLVPRLDVGPEQMHGGHIRNIRPVRSPLRSPSVQEANHATKSVNDKGARVSLG